LPDIKLLQINNAKYRFNTAGFDTTGFDPASSGGISLPKPW